MRRTSLAFAVALLALLSLPSLSPAPAAPLIMSTIPQPAAPAVEARYRPGYCLVRRVRYCTRSHGIKRCSRWRVASIRCHR